MTPCATILAGATASGKTEAAISAARRMGAEIVSADSRQVYRDFHVGTAKPPGAWETIDGIPRYVSDGIVHHLVDFLSPTEVYTAGRFAKDALAALEDIRLRGKRALVVGGTGLYLRALARGLAPMPERDDAYRRSLEDLAAARGRPFLHARLAEVDPEAARAIPAQNLHRVVRALEVHHLTGVPISLWQKNTPAPAWQFTWYGLRWPRPLLEERLKARCAQMAEAGLLAETRALLAGGVPPSAPAFQSLGYREAAARLRGELNDAQWTEAFYRATRQYAKRQETWFRAEKAIHWFDVEAADDLLSAADTIAASAQKS